MDRRICVHPLRHRIDLAGLWDFLAEERPRTMPPPGRAYRERLPVPGVWETAFRHFRYKGFAWYRREFEVPAGRPAPLRLAFGAVSLTAEVWLDGRRLGAHHGAHTAFEFTIPSVGPGTHELAVRVGNAYGPDNPLFYPDQDIYLFGGIPRPVYAERLPDVWIADASAIPARDGRGWRLDVTVRLARAGAACAWPAHARVRLDGAELGIVRIGRDGRGAARLDAGRAEAWSPERPRLYAVRVEAGPDAWQERIGFRTVAVRGRDILLNGEPLTLRGVNRHEFHPDFGPALPLTVHARDIELLHTLGANFVRGSHYPNDPLFLDLCDENGILFWDELSHWQPREEDFRSPLFLQRSLDQLDEMVAQHRHHPAVILWGMMNEAATYRPGARRVVRALAGQFRKLDPSRPVTFASCSPGGDRCLDLVDVVSVNTYPGWYWLGIDEAPKKMAEVVRLAARRGGNKPIIMSEFGGGAMDGVRSFESRKWTENYQADLLRRLIDAIRDTRRVCGVAIWQYCDVRTSADIAMKRIREYNNKGILTEHREPKLGFFAVQEAFRRFR
jgi:beta-glucuronidase